MDSDIRKAAWDSRYQSIDDSPPIAAQVLVDHSFLLPPSGKALDLACGRGGNALLLAQAGLDVVAWDYSSTVIDGLNLRAQAEALSISTEVRDVVTQPPKNELFDVIVVSYFLERQLCEMLVDSLNEGGLLYYETFSVEAVSERGPSNPDFRLETNELLRLFPSLRVLHYEEMGRVGDSSRGIRDVAMLVAQK